MPDATVRLCRRLDQPFAEPVWPQGVRLAAMEAHHVPQLHALLAATLGDVPADVAEWWQALSTDSEFDPELCFLAVDDHGQLLGAAQCWTSAFIKSLAVAEAARHRGIGTALLLHCFGMFKAKGHQALYLKTDRVKNAAALRLYLRHGMVEVPLV